MKPKYILMFVASGVTKQIEYARDQKAEAVAALKNIGMRSNVSRIRLFSIDSEDGEIWYDLTNKELEA